MLDVSGTRHMDFTLEINIMLKNLPLQEKNSQQVQSAEYGIFQQDKI